MKPEYITLKAGDRRQDDDEWRTSDNGPVSGKYITGKGNPSRGGGIWKKCDALIGHVITASDLCHLEFRRPV